MSFDFTYAYHFQDTRATSAILIGGLFHVFRPILTTHTRVTQFGREYFEVICKR